MSSQDLEKALFQNSMEDQMEVEVLNCGRLRLCRKTTVQVKLVSKFTAGSWLRSTEQRDRIAFDGDRRQHSTAGRGQQEGGGNSFQSIGTIIVAHFKEKK